MSKRAGRNLNPVPVQMALQTQARKHELAMKMVSERVKIDAEFAADVLKIGGELLREDIKKDAKETIAKDNYDKAISNSAKLLADDIDQNFLESQAVKNALSQGVILHQNGNTTVKELTSSQD